MEVYASWEIKRGRCDHSGV